MDGRLVVGAAAVAAAIPGLVWSIAVGRDHSAAAVRNLSLERAPRDLRDIDLRRPATERAVQPVTRWLAAQGRHLTPAGILGSLDRRRVLAGARAWSVERLLAAKGIGALVGAAVGAAIFLVWPGAFTILLLVACAVVGSFVPDLVLLELASRRQAEIHLALPDTMDQISISVDAGLGFEAALARAAQAGRGALADELLYTLREIQVGVPRAEAMHALMERTSVDELRHFILAIRQAEAYGVPIAQVLRVQAAELREKRRQHAEEEAMKVPVKIVFPLVLCILPSLFVVLIGPALIRISDSLFQ